MTTTLSPASIELVYNAFRVIEEYYTTPTNYTTAPQTPNPYAINNQYRQIFDYFLLCLTKINYTFDKSLETKSMVNDLVLLVNGIFTGLQQGPGFTFVVDGSTIPSINATVDQKMPTYLRKINQFYRSALISRGRNPETVMYDIGYFPGVYTQLINFPYARTPSTDPIVVRIKNMYWHLFSMPDNLDDRELYSFKNYYDFFTVINTNLITDRTLKVFIIQMAKYLTDYAKYHPYILN